MNTDKIAMRFSEADVDWDELAGIGIMKDELEQAGELTTLLSGGKTGVLTLSLVLLGADVVLDATLQLVRKRGAVLLDIVGIADADADGFDAPPADTGSRHITAATHY
jgi:hypothetical protein